MTNLDVGDHSGKGKAPSYKQRNAVFCYWPYLQFPVGAERPSLSQYCPPGQSKQALEFVCFSFGL